MPDDPVGHSDDPEKSVAEEWLARAEEDLQCLEEDGIRGAGAKRGGISDGASTDRGRSGESLDRQEGQESEREHHPGGVVEVQVVWEQGGCRKCLRPGV